MNNKQLDFVLESYKQILEKYWGCQLDLFCNKQDLESCVGYWFKLLDSSIKKQDLEYCKIAIKNLNNNLDFIQEKTKIEVLSQDL